MPGEDNWLKSKKQTDKQPTMPANSNYSCILFPLCKILGFKFFHPNNLFTSYRRKHKGERRQCEIRVTACVSLLLDRTT